MSELYYAVPPETLARLPKHCRDCLLARFTIEQAFNSEADTEAVIDDIHATCTGWRDDQDPMESVMSTEGPTLDLVAIAIEDNCPYDMGNVNNPRCTISRLEPVRPADS